MHSDTWVVSEGDPSYGYDNEFVEEHWNIGGDTTYSPTSLQLTTNTLNVSGYSLYNATTLNPNDLSFCVRYTVDIWTPYFHADGIAFVISPDADAFGTLGGSIGYGGMVPSVAVELDHFSNPGTRHHDSWGNDYWISGESNSHIAITLDGNPADH